MQYPVSENFYALANDLIATALEDEDMLEYEIAVDFLRDLHVGEVA